MIWALARSAALLVLGALPILSAPTAWTLAGVTSLGTSITGSFVFDANTETYSDLDISTSGGSVIPSDSSCFKAPAACLGAQRSSPS